MSWTTTTTSAASPPRPLSQRIICQSESSIPSGKYTRRGKTNMQNGINEATPKNARDRTNSNPPFDTTHCSSRRQWFDTVADSVVVVLAGSVSAFLASPETSHATTDVITTAAVCDPAVSVWKKNGRIVYLLGTAHVSSVSAALAGQLVRDTVPSAVFVELDPKRVTGSSALAQRVGDAVGGANAGVDSELPSSKSRIIVPQIRFLDGSATMGGDRSNETPSTEVPMMGGLQSKSPATPPASPPATPPATRPSLLTQAATAAVGNSIKGMYKSLDSAGFESGEEFVVAMEEGRKLGSDIVLGDRDVEVTLRRVTEGLAKTDLRVLLNPDSELERSLQEFVPPSRQVQGVAGNAGSGGGSNSKVSQSNEEFREEFSTFVETMKSKENVQKIMEQLKRVAPFLYEALVSERDAYMAAGLNGLNELETIVAVVGIAHVNGIEGNLQSNGWTQATPRCSNIK